MEYIDFLKSKIQRAPVSGFDVDPSTIHPALKPHQRDAVEKAKADSGTEATAAREEADKAKAVVQANLHEWCNYTITTMAELEKVVAV